MRAVRALFASLGTVGRFLVIIGHVNFKIDLSNVTLPEHFLAKQVPITDMT